MSLSFSSPRAATGNSARSPVATTAASAPTAATTRRRRDEYDDDDHGHDHSNHRYPPRSSLSLSQKAEGGGRNRGSSSSSSPLENPTLLGQLHQLASWDENNGDNNAAANATTTTTLPMLPKPPPPPHHHHPLTTTTKHPQQQQQQHLYVLPVLLLEFLAIALTRAVLPGMLLEEYGSNVYLVLGAADCVRGLLAFFACPLFGKLSDMLFGRRLCLFITVLGSCAPVCSLAFFTGWDALVEMEDGSVVTSTTTSSTATATTTMTTTLPPMAIPLFVVLLSLSGIFSSTFTLVFAYISDSVRERNERVSAYGLALATFGLSFTMGPMAGGYLANYKTEFVFRSSMLLTVLDLLYIYWFLPESKPPPGGTRTDSFFSPLQRQVTAAGMVVPSSSDASTTSNTSATSFFVQIADTISWSPWESLNLVLQDPFLRKVGQVAFFYYTGLWAVISTLSLYAVQHFHMTPERLGELMSALGLSTMVAEAVLVRLMVPLVGEKRAIRIGLASFAIQCIVLGFASETWELFICVAFSLLGNLVYPSLSSMVSGTVSPDMVGEALGAINGIKALTEGLGPLLFGALMTVSEHTTYPGSPYWLASVLVFIAYRMSARLPDSDDDDVMMMDNTSSPSPVYSSFSSPDKYPPHPLSPVGRHKKMHVDEYVHELEFKRRIPKGLGSNYGVRRQKQPQQGDRSDGGGGVGDDNDDCLSTMFPSLTRTPIRDDHDEEYQALLSEVEESDPDNSNNNTDNENDDTCTSNYVSAEEWDDDETTPSGSGDLADVTTDLSFAQKK